MQPKLELLDHTTFILSPSQLDEIKTCSRRWLFKYLWRRVRATPNAAAQGGKSADAAFNHRYKKLGNAAVDPETEAEMLAIVDAAYAGVELPLEEYRTAARYKEVVQAYNAHWGAEPFEVLGVQLPFHIRLGEVRVTPSFWVEYYGYLGLPCPRENPEWILVLLHGILDLFVRLQGHVIIVDTKTSKSGREGAYKNSPQMKAYAHGLQELARQNPGHGLPEKVHATMINEVIIRPPYKAEGRAAKATDRARTEFHRTFPEFIKQEALEEWKRDTLYYVQTAMGWLASNHFPQCEKHCNSLYGYPCGYRDSVCLIPAAQRPMALASDEFMDYERGPLAAPAVEVPS